MNDFKNKKINVIGAARSGLAAAKALRKLGADVFLSESANEGKLANAVKILSAADIQYEFGGHTQRAFDCEMIVTSPGVPVDSEILQKALTKNIKIISELELGFRLCRGNVLAITGSNGKTTTTSLIGEIFEQAGIQAVVAGNIGTPFVGIADEIGPDGWAIVEVSTFQLEWIESFQPKVATVLNITPDHLDRHKTMANYIDLKRKICANQNGTDKAVCNFDDVNLRQFKSESEMLWFSTSEKLVNGCFIDKGKLVSSRERAVIEIIDVNKIKIKGPHNLSNACAAAACCIASGIKPEAIASGLEQFTGVEHRLEIAGLIGGVSYVNDSKATNVDAVFWALQSVPPPIILIAGGRDKAGDFTRLSDLVKQNVKCIITLGEAASKIKETFEDITEIIDASDLNEAVDLAGRHSGDVKTVLLSPGCASFDMFENFEHRGRLFKRAVSRLKKEAV